jgi:hypothetical protein
MSNEQGANNIGESRPKNKGQFKKGDPRCWRKGRPRSFDALRALAQQIAHEVAQSGGEDIVIAGHKVTVAEMILRSWAQSKNTQLQKGFIEIAFGKVPDEIIVDWREELTRHGIDASTVFDQLVAAIAEATSGADK